MMKNVKLKLNIDYDKKLDKVFGFNVENITKKVLSEAMNVEKVPFDISINLSIVSDKKIKTINKSERNIDKVTDVLSFPVVDYKKPATYDVFFKNKKISIDYLDLDTNTVFLGDIVINKNRVLSQSKLYNHSIKREYAFLLTHSFLHLVGFDHMKKNDEEKMCMEQEKILTKLKISR